MYRGDVVLVHCSMPHFYLFKTIEMMIIASAKLISVFIFSTLEPKNLRVKKKYKKTQHLTGGAGIDVQYARRHHMLIAVAHHFSLICYGSIVHTLL